MTEDNKLIEIYNARWNIFSNLKKKWFGNEPVYDCKYMNTKIKLYNGKISTNLHVNKIPKGGMRCICLSLILLVSVVKMAINYYPKCI